MQEQRNNALTRKLRTGNCPGTQQLKEKETALDRLLDICNPEEVEEAFSLMFTAAMKTGKMPDGIKYVGRALMTYLEGMREEVEHG